MKKKILFLTVLFSSFLSIAQTNNSEKAGFEKSYISVDPLTIINPYEPRLRVGYVHKLSKAFSLGVDLGYGNEVLTFLRRDNYQFYEVRPQLYYFLNNRYDEIKYVSVEVLYTDYKEHLNSGTYKIEDDYYAFDSSNYQKQKLVIQFIYGVFDKLFNGLDLDVNCYVGAGLGIKHNAFTNVVNKQTTYEPDVEPIFFDKPIQIEGLQGVINITAGVKLFFGLNSKKHQ